MSLNLTSDELKAVLSALQATTDDQKPYINLVSEILHKRWASFTDIEDLFYLMDSRIDSIRSDMTVRRWCEILSIPFRSVYFRPASQQIESLGFQAVSATDVAGLLINLESLGFRTDPSPLVRELLPTIKLRQFLTDHELSILWYAKARGKKTPLTLSVMPVSEQTETQVQIFTTQTGYQIEYSCSEESRPIWLSSRSPRYRRRPTQKSETCAACGYEWTRGDTGSSAAHRKEHKRRLAYLEPKPIAEMISEFGDAGRLVVVTTASSIKMHKEIYLRALAFKREFGYDFVQWGKPRGTDPDARGFLFLNSEGIILGACAFRNREHQNTRWQALDCT
jgi:hypothetical protein